MLNTWKFAAAAVTPPESIAPMSRTPTPPGAAGPGPLHAALRQVAASIARLAAGTTLTIRGREDSAARVLDGQTVEFKGERLSFNDWGQRVTRWTSIRIYTMACLPDGRTLDQLRDRPASVKGGT